MTSSNAEEHLPSMGKVWRIDQQCVSLSLGGFGGLGFGWGLEGGGPEVVADGGVGGGREHVVSEMLDAFVDVQLIGNLCFCDGLSLH